MKSSLFVCTIVVLGAGLCAAGFSQTEASSAPNKGEEIFAHKCVTCHGNDGTGTQVGKSLNVADLRSALVQKKSDAELSHIISEGKNSMPPFGNDLTPEDIKAVVAFVRTFKIKKK